MIKISNDQMDPIDIYNNIKSGIYNIIPQILLN